MDKYGAEILHSRVTEEEKGEFVARIEDNICPNPVTKIGFQWEKSARSRISNFTYFIWVWSLRKNPLHAIRCTIFQPCVPFR